MVLTRHKSGFAPGNINYWPVAIAAIAYAGASAYSAHEESKAAKKSAEAQERVGMAQIEAPIKAEQATAEAAKARLKLKQASKSNNILSAPGGMEQASDSTNMPSILGV